MPGNIAAPTPTLVMPQQLCTAFSESRNYEQLRNEYHDGTPQASQLAQASRRTWKLSRRLIASQLATLRTFWENVGGGLKPFLFYNPYEGSPVGSNYDAAGVNPTGRYVAAFRNNWMQTTGLSRTDASQLELVQLDDMDPAYAAVMGFGIHGAITTATVTVWTAFINTTGAPAIAHVWLNASDLVNTNTPYALRSDSSALTSPGTALRTLVVSCAILNPIGDVATGLASSIRIYDCYADVTYADATTGRLRPISTSMNTQGPPQFGAIADAANAIDADTDPPATYATLTRTDYDALDFYNSFQMFWN